MKGTTCIAILALFGLVSAIQIKNALKSQDDEYTREFSRFSSRFGRNYQSQGDYSHRL
jgi:hypothetical protein